MKKKFNNEHTPKSSENCNKFYKSVSYETLVGGTTTGRERGKALEIEGVITRRTSVRRGYLIEQGAHANKESLFSCVTCFMRLPRRILRMLLVMTIPALALILTLATITESRADCKRPNSKTGVCKTLGESGTCGTGCSYTYDEATQTVNITATGENAEIGYAVFHRFYYEGNSMPARKFIINGAVRIGDTAIISNRSLIVSGADGALVLTGLGQAPIGQSGMLSGTIIIPEGATFALSAFNGKFAADAKIYCNVENCEQKMIEACGGDLSSKSCKNVSKIISEGQLFPFPDGCAVMGATGCIKCKSDSFKLNDGYCDRIRYTPAEAAEVLHNDNTNSVTITFKK